MRKAILCIHYYQNKNLKSRLHCECNYDSIANCRGLEFNEILSVLNLHFFPIGIKTCAVKCITQALIVIHRFFLRTIL